MSIMQIAAAAAEDNLGGGESVKGRPKLKSGRSATAASREKSNVRPMHAAIWATSLTSGMRSRRAISES